MLQDILDVTCLSPRHLIYLLQQGIWCESLSCLVIQCLTKCHIRDRFNDLICIGANDVQREVWLIRKIEIRYQLNAKHVSTRLCFEAEMCCWSMPVRGRFV